MLSTTFFLVRHGDTPLSGTFCGSLNPPLSSHGRIQARRAALHLKSHRIEQCYTSPLLRAHQTATMMHRVLHVPVTIADALHELHFGTWEGMTFSAIEEKWPALASRWARNPMSVRIPEAETFASLRKRIRSFLRQMTATHILIVAHGGSLSALTLELLGLPNADFPKHILSTGSVRMIQRQKVHDLC